MGVLDGGAARIHALLTVGIVALPGIRDVMVPGDEPV